MDDTEEKIPKNEPVEKYKYNVIPKFTSPTQELFAIDLVASHDGQGHTYLNFIDAEGRLWKGLLDDFVVIRNYPTKEDMEDFERLKREVEENESQLRKNKTQYNPMVI